MASGDVRGWTAGMGAAAYAAAGSGDGELRDGRRDGELRERMQALGWGWRVRRRD